jgi:hypothetical protein
MPEKPKFGLMDSPFANPIPLDQLGGAINKQIGGIDLNGVPKNNPAYQPPHDPLAGVTRDEIALIARDLPLIETIHDWTVDSVRAALAAHCIGQFYWSGLLIDAVLGDPRIQATLGSLISAIFGREVIFRPANDSSAAKECQDAWVSCWPRLANSSTFNELETISKMAGWVPAQLLWDTSDDNLWKPTLQPWHISYSYYHWDAKCYVALSRDGSLAMRFGNAKWVGHFPNGEYRGFIRGSIRAVAEPFLTRHQSTRDHNRYNEVHGLPIKKCFAPAASSEADRDKFVSKIMGLGRESAILLARGNDDQGKTGYDLELMEAKDESWQSFVSLGDRADMDIVLAILFQNLTTEVTGGSFAATKSHMDVRQGAAQYEMNAWAWTIYSQIARVFAWLNFGDPELAPMTTWDVLPLDDIKAHSENFNKFMTGIEVGRRGGVQFDEPDQVQSFAAKRFGLRDLPKFSIVAPVGRSGGGTGEDPSVPSVPDGEGK